MKILKYLVALLMLIPCYAMAQKFDYKISSEIKGLGNDTLMLSVVDLTGVPGKTIKIAGKNDMVEAEGSAQKVEIVFAQILGKQRSGNFILFLEKGKMQINGSMANVEGITVTGTPINDEYTAGNKILLGFYSRRTQAYKNAQAMTDKQSEAFKIAAALPEKISDSLYRFQVSSFEKNPSSMFGAMQLYLLSDKIPVEDLEKYYMGLKAPARDLPILNKIPGKIIGRKKSKIGNPAPEFSIKDSKGNLVRLSDFKGKYVLLDFWASWCVPCRKESPGLVKAYQKYGGKSFEILSIAINDTDKKWRQAIAEDHLEAWLHASDYKDPKNAIGLSYGVQPIPDNFLIDPTGKIIGRALFGTELEKKLSLLINK